MAFTGTSCQGAVGGGGRVIFFRCESLFPGVKILRLLLSQIFIHQLKHRFHYLNAIFEFFRQFASRCLHNFQKGDLCVKVHPKRVNNIAAGKVFVRGERGEWHPFFFFFFFDRLQRNQLTARIIRL